MRVKSKVKRNGKTVLFAGERATRRVPLCNHTIYQARLNLVPGFCNTGTLGPSSSQSGGLYGVAQWLQDFAYRVPLNGWIFILVGLFSLFIALLTISLQAAKNNPINSLVPNKFDLLKITVP